MSNNEQLLLQGKSDDNDKVQTKEKLEGSVLSLAASFEKCRIGQCLSQTCCETDSSLPHYSANEDIFMTLFLA